MNAMLRLGVVGILAALVISAQGCSSTSSKADGQGASSSSGASEAGRASAAAGSGLGGSKLSGAGGAVGSAGIDGTAGSVAVGGAAPVGPGLGAAEFAAGDLDAVSDGGTITLQNIGAPGWYPSRRDPASGQCDAISTSSCGQGPCGKNCNLTGLGPADLISKQNSQPATQGGIVTPQAGPDVAFRRPAEGYRFVLILLDTETRTIQLAIIHPSKVPAAAAGLLPNLPVQLGRSTIDALLELRLPT